MTPEKLTIKVALQIQKPKQEVFEAIVNPTHMCNYFIATSSGPMEAGKTVFWSFPEFPDEEPVNIDQIKPYDYISFYWKIDNLDHFVEMQLDEKPDKSTLVTITEKDRPNNAAGIAWLMGNTEGWMNFLCCLKAYLEYGINLRKGGYDYLKK